MKYNPLKKILILVTILAVPGFLYYLLQDKGKNRYRPLAIYGPKKLSGTFHSVRGKQIPDTVYHILPDFTFRNQQDSTRNWSSYKGQILLMNLFYTQGQSYGLSTAAKAMAKFAAAYRKNPMVHLASISIDPAVDQPAQLHAYAQRMAIPAAKWDLLTGDSSQVSTFVTKGLLLDALKTTEAGKPRFIYSNLFVLIDPQHRIRGYYEAANPEAISKLEDEIKVLIAEELRNMNDGR